MRVILVDDAVLVREGIARLLADAGVEVAAQLPDTNGLLSTVRRVRPHVAWSAGAPARMRPVRRWRRSSQRASDASRTGRAQAPDPASGGSRVSRTSAVPGTPSASTVSCSE